MTHRHTAYGLQFSSDIPLLEFPSGSGTAQVIVRYSSEPEWNHGPKDAEYEVTLRPRFARFWFREAGAFVVRNGDSILVDRAPDVSPDLIRLYIEGMITAMLLHQRGFCVLHASVINIGGEAVAFLGPVGAGKSSMAAALHARGHAVISDDNAAVRIAGGCALVVPAYPYLKLFPAIAASLGYGADRLRSLHSAQNKMAGAVGRDFQCDPVPLRRLYLLGRDPAAHFKPVNAARLLIELVRNSVPTRWGCNGDQEHLLRCGQLAGSTDAFSVETFERLDSLPALAEAVEAHCERASAFVSAPFGDGSVKCGTVAST